MLCSVSQRKFSELASSLERETTLKRLPYMVSMELTYRCNQNCCHCFCNLPFDDTKKTEELDTQQVKSILDDITAAGCLWLLFTGGEVLIREDFFDIYRYALKKGLMVEVFTNGSLISSDIARQFAEYSSLGIEITIYGASPEIHDAVTRVKGSFARTMQGIEQLLKYNVPFALKTILLTLNYGDLKNMRKLAADLKVDFKSDSLICPRKDSDNSPLRYRLTVEDAVALEFLDEKDVEIGKKIFSEFWGKGLDDMFICGGGINSFGIDPYGTLSPCTMFQSFQYSLKSMGFKEARQRLINDYGNGGTVSDECRACRMVSLCPVCPAWKELESGGFKTKVDYLCQYSLGLEKKYFEKIKEGQDAKKDLSKT